MYWNHFEQRFITVREITVFYHAIAFNLFKNRIMMVMVV